MLAKDSITLDDGSVKYPVDMQRFDEFFTALSCGIVFKTCGNQVPENYVIHHQYPNFSTEHGGEQGLAVFDDFKDIIYGEPLKVLDFGKPNTQNENIYTVKVIGIPDFNSSITIVHLFYGKFEVISFLSNCR